MITSLLIATLTLNTVVSVQPALDGYGVLETCVISQSNLPTVTLEGPCEDWVEPVIKSRLRNYPNIPYNVVLNGNELNRV